MNEPDLTAKPEAGGKETEAEAHDLMTKAEAQGYLRCSHQTLHRLMTKHGLPYFKVARRVLFRREAVDAWLEARKVVSALPEKPQRRGPFRKK